ncbi:MAG TPA: isoaspartyl peptidase/L-asparaginase [Candidatus Woesebacteria bacterium]|nr:isoaspartyl peptidase/L-asparaginase [Candidatus Woesebacteria bacterium]
MKPILVIHGGAIFDESDYNPANDQQYKDVLRKSLDAGYTILEKEGTSLDAIEASIQILEDCGLFDAGKGAVYSADGKQEFDASIMDGSNLKAGAIAGVRRIKSPISAAKKVMEKTRHVTLIGEGAEEFAKQQGLEMVDPEYFFNQQKWDRYQSLKSKENKFTEKDHSTVGAIALDVHGNLAAGTSTGGLEMKYFGRIGDSPIIGAGTYADNKFGAVSCTGQGEYFMRTVAAYDVIAKRKYQQKDLESSIKESMKTIQDMGANGGMIGLDDEGNIVMYCTTQGMFRGFKKENEVFVGCLMTD